ncbi:hypothetical protein HC891_26690 [Candidatus Gracilibacteria bacterium]|nr:hypothetical protein [Candidatus Gracilibacteria bacterium]
MAETLQIVHTIDYKRGRADVLMAIAPYLPPELLAEALQTKRTIEREENFIRVLVDLVPRLPSELFAEAFQAAHAIKDEKERAKVLVKIASYLPPKLIANGLEAARAISSEHSHIEVLAKLAPILAGIPAKDALFVATLRDSARRGRPILLNDLAALMPWITALAKRAQQPMILAALARAVIETARCWP